MEWCWPLSRLLPPCQVCGTTLVGLWPRAYWICNVHGGRMCSVHKVFTRLLWVGIRSAGTEAGLPGGVGYTVIKLGSEVAMCLCWGIWGLEWCLPSPLFLQDSASDLIPPRHALRWVNNSPIHMPYTFFKLLLLCCIFWDYLLCHFFKCRDAFLWPSQLSHHQAH